jgi:PAT family beta-lactamase induction signal transducer AmpG
LRSQNNSTREGSTIVSPIASFFRQNGMALAIAILAFVFLFKIGEAFVGKMSIIFYDDIGFSKGDIGLYSKGLGWVTTIVFTLIGGWFAVKRGVVTALILAGLAMAATNLLFSLMAWQGEPSTWLFAIAVVVDDAAAAIATVIFVTFISLLVDRTYTATQYALLSSIGTSGRTVVAASSGALVDGLGGDWGTFFLLTAVMVLPSLVLLFWLRNRLPIGQAERSDSTATLQPET